VNSPVYKPQSIQSELSFKKDIVDFNEACLSENKLRASH